ncbi:MAG TPA: amidohydrolase family protein [Candidatus Acidoferrales bacterium]|nr:amidohydrolase family protein [Candidatus Acidoferrales bacterium]
MIKEKRIHLLAVCFASVALCAAGFAGLARLTFGQEQSGLAKSAGLSRAGEPRFFAIKGARIVTASGPAIEKGTVVVANGIITAVGTDASVPPEAAVIDGTGLTVYPGLIDAGTTVGLPGPEKPEGAGERGHGPRGPAPAKISTGPQDRPLTTPWRVAADELNPDDPRVANWRNAGFTTGLVQPDGGIFPGQGSVVDFGAGPAGKMVVKPLATLPVAFQTTGSFASFPSSLMGAIAYVRQVFIDTRWYAEAQPVYAAHPQDREHPPYDRTEVTVGEALQAGEPVLLPANNRLAVYRAIRLANEWQIHAAMYGAQNGYEMAGEIAASKMPVFVNVNWPHLEKDADETQVTLRELRLWDRAPSTPAALSKAGVMYAFYSGGLKNPKEILKDVKKAIDAGLSPGDALKAMTVNPAQILGVADRMGSIEKGKIANLVVADGDIFDEKTKIKDVFVDGMRYQVHADASPGPAGDSHQQPMEEGHEEVRQ